MAKYEWIDSERTMFETQIKEKQRDPDFQYVGEHIETITEDLANHLMYNTLTIKVLGMIESRRKNKKPQEKAYQSDYQSDVNHSPFVDQDNGGMQVQAAVGEGSTPTPGGSKKSNTIRADPRMADLEKQTAQLMKQLQEA